MPTQTIGFRPRRFPRRSRKDSVRSVLSVPVISVGGNGRFGLSSLSAPLVLPDPGATFGAYELGSALPHYGPRQ